MKITKFLCTMIAGGFALSSAFGAANPDTNGKTKRLHNWVKNFGGNYNRVLCGQQIAPNSKSAYVGTFGSNYWDLGAQSYLNPAMIGGDIGEHNDAEVWEMLGTMDWHADNEKNVITLSWHVGNPFTGGGYRDTTWWGVDALLPGGWNRSVWLQKLDKAATYLQFMEDQGHPVLWRPLHEMNGDWFWWGGRSASDYKKLWRDMFNYFTYTKGLDNLLWVYSPNNYFSWMNGDYSDYYPGSSYVDFVGADVYEDDAFINNTSDLTGLSKPALYTEFGPSRSDGNFGYWTLINRIEVNHPWIKGWLSWNDWKNGNTWNYKAMATNRHEWHQWHDWVVNSEDVSF